MSDYSHNAIELICTKFQQLWHAGATPQIHVALRNACESEILFQRLLSIELDHRRNRGESPTAEQYLEQFPQYQGLIERAFRVFRVEVFAQRKRPPHFKSMLAVVDACAAAGVSYPVEILEFFGDALYDFGPNASKLRAAVELVPITTTGDFHSQDGIVIRLDELPHGTMTVRICVSDRRCDDESSVDDDSSYVDLFPGFGDGGVNLVPGGSDALASESNVLVDEYDTDLETRVGSSHGGSSTGVAIRLMTDGCAAELFDDTTEFVLDSDLALLAGESDVLAGASNIGDGNSDVLSGDSIASSTTSSGSGLSNGDSDIRKLIAGGSEMELDDDIDLGLDSDLTLGEDDAMHSQVIELGDSDVVDDDDDFSDASVSETKSNLTSTEGDDESPDSSGHP